MPERDPSMIAGVRLIVGLEVHVELATRSKMFARVASPAGAAADDHPPNTLIDPVVLGLPGALPVMNKAAVEMAMMVGLALDCRVADFTKWDRKSYFYPDLPKAYQISQYDLPLCGQGYVELPATDERGFADLDKPTRRIGIIRAHLEEDAGKLLHDSPGGHAIDFSIADYNRAGTPLLEIVTQPDFVSADEVVLFAKMLRNICMFLGVTHGVMQKGHMRFEPNINCELTLEGGRTIRTPVVEIKNLNSFKSLRGAIEFELQEQPRRWVEDGREMGAGMKTTRGWDDARAVTFPQREKEDAHDYRYFPDPDLPPVVVDEPWLRAVRARVPELPLSRLRRYVRDYGVPAREAPALVEERDTCLFYEACVDALAALGVEKPRAGKAAANIILSSGFKRANESGAPVHALGVAPAEVAAIAKLREDGRIGNQAVDALFGALAGPDAASPERQRGAQDASAALASIEQEAARLGLLIVRDDAAMQGWIDQVLAANPKVAQDVRAGKVQAVGRLVGEVMKLAGGKADAKAVRETILKCLGQ